MLLFVMIPVECHVDFSDPLAMMGFSIVRKPPGDKVKILIKLDKPR
jgi:hypothetical protein